MAETKGDDRIPVDDPLHRTASLSRLTSSEGASESSETAIAESQGEDLHESVRKTSDPASVRKNRESGHRKDRIEELQVKPGREKTIFVKFKVMDEGSNMETQRSSKLPLQKLEKCNFRIMLKCRSEDESSDYNFFTTIKALSRVCKSIISLSKGTLNMGDCTIGSVKNSSFQVTNLSDLPAHLELEFVPKVVSCFPMTPVVPPHQTQEFKIRMLPRKINPNYKKVITVVNKDSGAEDLPLEVSANNMDTHGVLSHSRFYRIDTKLSSD
eukprot:134915_1